MAERSGAATIDRVFASAYRIPTDRPEADGTLAWTSTTLVVVYVSAGGRLGLGLTYAHASVLAVIEELLAPAIANHDCFDVGGCWIAMQRAVRNVGRSGIASCAISAIDLALWDLKAQLLNVPLAKLLGCCRGLVPVYGSGGFTSYSNEELGEQLGHWSRVDGCRFVKMKIGSDPELDPKRAEAARLAIGDCQLFVDANGAFGVEQALRFAARTEDLGIRWFEEPVTSDDSEGLHAVRTRTPPGLEVAAGEYVFTLDDARHLLSQDAVDVLQADVTRCGGITGFLRIAALAEARHMEMSAHCAPAMHRHIACAIPRLRHIEWFHDHVRIEQMLFDGAPAVRDGQIAPDLTRVGHGLRFKATDAVAYHISGDALA
ncbi:mandelate racemase [Bradyrhizobium macuxiense]|uniref:Mandelate racemase n=1 Tax=Bradyrhizobium macuxiense TaxID=1755647 RepID=A0A109JXR3_9BRAD|nr:enolase C-terminal domain-like protein [Bradyrhizobium macuxiense]KWV57057.1 mandelate racemase [Bradyrhizobium macuxiense]